MVDVSILVQRRSPGIAPALFFVLLHDNIDAIEWAGTVMFYFPTDPDAHPGVCRTNLGPAKAMGEFVSP